MINFKPSVRRYKAFKLIGCDNEGNFRIVAENGFYRARIGFLREDVGWIIWVGELRWK